MAIPKSFKDMSGQRFTRLIVTARAGSDSNGNARWHCQCDCGNTTISSGFTLRNGQAKSCGCLTTGQLIERITKHSKAKTPEYMIWAHMLQRCLNPNNKAYGNYGGRGITVCAEWQRSFESFFDHIGPRPSIGHSLDRKNNEEGYYPGNVKWSTRREQLVNKRSTRFVEYKGKRMSLIEAIEAAPYPITTGGVRGRLDRGWTLEEALDTPPNQNIWRDRKRKED